MQPSPRPPVRGGTWRDRARGLHLEKVGEVGEAGACECRSLFPIPSPESPLRPESRVRVWGRWGSGPPHLLPLTLLQRPQRRVVEPEQQEAGPGRGAEAEPELPTQKLLGSRHGREVEGRQNSRHTRGPPPTTFALQGETCTAGSPGRSRPRQDPTPGPTHCRRHSRSSPAAWAALRPPASRPERAGTPTASFLIWHPPLFGLLVGAPSVPGKKKGCGQPQTPHPESPVPPQFPQQT